MYNLLDLSAFHAWQEIPCVGGASCCSVAIVASFASSEKTRKAHSLAASRHGPDGSAFKLSWEIDTQVRKTRKARKTEALFARNGEGCGFLHHEGKAPRPPLLALSASWEDPTPVPRERFPGSRERMSQNIMKRTQIEPK